MLSDIVGFLRCPVCAEGLVEAPGSLRCSSGHVFDVARQGYVNLAVGDGAAGRTAARGDTAAMIEARARFLEAGHFAPIAHEVSRLAASSTARRERAQSARPGPPLVVDVGAGTGYYLARALDTPAAGGGSAVGLALDASKYAARRAAKGHPRIGSVVCDTWQGLPVRDGAAACVLDVFAPRNVSEFARVLEPGGTLVVVTPTEHHLQELVVALGLLEVDAGKDERVSSQLDVLFRGAGSRTVEYPLSLSRAAVAQVVGMGPSAWHADVAALAEVIARMPEPCAVTASVRIAGYAPR